MSSLRSHLTLAKLICPVLSCPVLYNSCHNGDDEDEHAEHHQDHASPPALARRVNDAHSLDALLVAACENGRAQDRVLNRRLIATIV